MARKTEVREVPAFSEIVLEGTGDLTLVQDPGATPQVEIEADEDILEVIKVEVRDERLILGLDLPWWEWLTWWLRWVTITDRAVRYRVTCPKFEGATIRGSGRVTAGALSGETPRLRISGSGRIEIDEISGETLGARIGGSGRILLHGGSAHRLEARVSGSGRIEAGDVVAQEARIDISGSGNVAVNATETLDLHISGSGRVRYRGRPQVSQHISGSGHVRAEGD